MKEPDFDPNGIGLDNGKFIGLPFDEEDARIVMLSIPWDASVSYGEGTALGPANILKASTQLDLYHPEIEDAWKLGIYMRPAENWILQLNNELRPQSRRLIAYLEAGNDIVSSSEMMALQTDINAAGEKVNKHVYDEAVSLLQKGQVPAVVGGEHSCPLGLLRALKEKYGQFGVLHIDAHMDLREAYEGFKYSHASIFYNAVSEGLSKNLVQVGVRDFCEEEVVFAQANGIEVFADGDIKTRLFNGESWKQLCSDIIQHLPEQVYISFDIDGLNPHLCPNTGTPVPGGLEYAEAVFLVAELVKSGREIIGFDLCEVAGHNEWDGNVGARVLYELCNWTGRSKAWV